MKASLFPVAYSVFRVVCIMLYYDCVYRRVEVVYFVWCLFAGREKVYIELLVRILKRRAEYLCIVEFEMF